MKKLLITGFASCALLAASCSTIRTENVDTDNDHGHAVLALDYRDFDNAAGKMIDSLLDSGALNHPQGKRYIVAVSYVKNDTTQKIDTDQLTKKIRTQLMRSGKAYTTTAVSGKGAEDSLPRQVRELRADDEFKQSTIAGKGQMIAPDYSLSGKIIQRTIRYDDKRQQIEYYFQLSMTQVSTGLALWEDEVVLSKRGSNKITPW